MWKDKDAVVSRICIGRVLKTLASDLLTIISLNTAIGHNLTYHGLRPASSNSTMNYC